MVYAQFRIDELGLWLTYKDSEKPEEIFIVGYTVCL